MGRIRARVKMHEISSNALTPIARWDVVPYQRINTTFKAGVVAFSKEGVEKVTFTATDGINTTNYTPVTSMTNNDRVSVVEYWTTIDPADFDDGVITLSAVVTGDDGGMRTLDNITLMANSGGTLAQHEAWVDGVGAGTPTVDDDTKPFATIGAAATAVVAANGTGYSDGGIIYLSAATHTWTGVARYSQTDGNQEWLTVKPAAGVTQAQAIIHSGYANIGLVKLNGVTAKWIDGVGRIGIICGYDEWSASNKLVWFSGCDIDGVNRYPVADNYQFNTPKQNYSAYFTDSSIANMAKACSWGKLCRGLTVSILSDDAFVNSNVIINCTVDDLDPGATGAHTDGIQFYYGYTDTSEQIIVYGYDGTNFSGQGIFWGGDTDQNGDPTTPCAGAAIVNMRMHSLLEYVEGISLYRSFSGQMLLWHVTLLTDRGDGYYPLYIGDGGEAHTYLDYLDVQACCIVMAKKAWTDATTTISLDWNQNHYITTSGFANIITPGTNYTTGDAGLDVNDYPDVGSALLDRQTPLLTSIDTDGTVRGDPAEVGAFEKP